MEYNLKIFLSLQAPGQAGGYMGARLKLPFVPYPNLQIDLGTTDDITILTVKTVVWNQRDKAFDCFCRPDMPIDEGGMDAAIASWVVCGFTPIMGEAEGDYGDDDESD